MAQVILQEKIVGNGIIREVVESEDVERMLKEDAVDAGTLEQKETALAARGYTGDKLQKLKDAKLV